MIVLLRQLPYIHAAQGDTASAYIPQRCDQPGDRGFSAAGGSNQGIDGTLSDLQVDAVKHFLLMISEGHIFELNILGLRLAGRGVRALHVLQRQQRCHLTDDGTQLCKIIAVRHDSDERRNQANGKKNDLNERTCVQRPSSE